MGLTNAEKQAAYRARYAEYKARVVELEAEVAELRAEAAARDALDQQLALLQDEPALA
jgi:cell division protein FtsB